MTKLLGSLVADQQDMEPEGFRHIPDFLSEGWQLRLLQTLGDIGPWDRVEFRGETARRRMLFFGASRERGAAGPFPAWLAELRDRCAGSVEIPRERLVQATVTWHAPGAGPGEQRESKAQGRELVLLSLGAEARLILRRGEERLEVPLPSGSLSLLSGPARFEWTHEIPPVKSARYTLCFRSSPAESHETDRLFRG